MWTLNNPLVKYYGKKALVLVIISFSALVFSTGLSRRVKIFNSDLYTGKKKATQVKISQQTPKTQLENIQVFYFKQ